ncbi:ferric reductase-like transmembrane domain-containing protein [Aquibium sp. A9E412]|uniref:ferredoxin reductase family protein n=1 Tax=Aquibium sp. A9E412 TaxID=2976767 RepID=UPI0025B0CD56|nr:ferric reductase-like transmembrane domain-containing protein [Aquibium sp. A9E412]MDN2565607.1 ferric reductase-like transmembrane domain-containing protein [Aquibium sp. A9E412]
MSEPGEETNVEDARGRHGRLRPSGRVLAVAYLGFAGAALALAATAAVAPLATWERAGAALGLVALAAMAVQFVTSGRFQTVSGRLGIDRIMAFHKIAAWWVLVGLVLHPLFYVLPTWADDAALGRERLVAYLTLPHYRSGVAALAALALLVASSALRERLPWRYEAWRASHVALALVAVGGGLHHAATVGRFSADGPLLGLWWAVGLGVALVVAVLYGWRWLRLHRRPWRLARTVRLADRMWELDIQPAPGTPPWRYRAGQFVWMTEGRRRMPLFDHPFSIADSPRRPGLSLIVKEAGDFTRTVGTLAPGTPIGIDGPYGEFTLEAHDGDAVLLLAGGVGIAPIMGLLRDMVARGERRPVRLGYAAGRPQNFACLAEIEAAGAVLDIQTTLASEEAAAGWQGVVGRLDRARLEAMLDGLDPARTVCFICGPGPMVTAVCDTLLALGVPAAHVVYERFDYAAGAASRLDRQRTLGFLAIGAGLAALAGVFTAAG